MDVYCFFEVFFSQCLYGGGSKFCFSAFFTLSGKKKKKKKKRKEIKKKRRKQKKDQLQSSTEMRGGQIPQKCNKLNFINSVTSLLLFVGRDPAEIAYTRDLFKSPPLTCQNYKTRSPPPKTIPHFGSLMKGERASG